MARTAPFRAKTARRELFKFCLFAGLGAAASYVSVQIPHTEVFIEGRWIFGFMGFALLRHLWTAALLAVLLSVALVSKTPVSVCYIGNMLYAIPALVVIRWVHLRCLAGARRMEFYAAGWFILVIFCYQAFTTPLTWATLAFLKGDPLWPAALEGWRSQPYLVEFLIVGFVSTSAMTAVRSYREMRQSREELAVTLDSIGDGMIAADADGRVTRINPVARQLTGWISDDAVGTPLEDVFRIINAETRQPADNPVARVLKEGKIVGLANHTCLISRNGAEYQIADSAAPIRAVDGRLIGAVMVFRDVTQEYENQEALRRSEARYRTLLEAVPFGVEEVDSGGRILFCNRAYAEMLGRSVDELTGTRTWDHDSTAEAAERTREMFAAATSETAPLPFVSRKTRKDGTLIDVAVHWILKHGDGGEREGGVAVVTDITDRLNSEAMRQQLEERLRQAQKMEAIGALAGGIAHDFNNLLFPITGLSEMLMEDLPVGGRKYEKASEIYRSARRAADLVKQILSFSRQSAQQKAPLRIQQILKEVFKLVRATIPADIEMTHSLQMDCGPVLADATQIHQIAMNLLTNAFHAVENSGGAIAVELKETELTRADCPGIVPAPGRYAAVSVSDTGCGIPSEMRTKIFDPYFTTKVPGKGTGLGLSVVFGIVKDHNGGIQVQSEVGKGTTFRVYLPLMSGHAERMVPETPIAQRFGTESVLLVDDEEPVMSLEKLMLERLGYRVTACPDGMEALAVFEKNPDGFDLVITDMAMPKMTGNRLAEALLNIRPDIPIIICTGFSEKMDQKKANRLGIKGYLMKPIVKSELGRMIRDALDERVN